MTPYEIARRSFLRGCGAGTLLLPLLRSIEARAQGLPAPLRFLVIHHPLGTQHAGIASRDDPWSPNATATTTNFTLPVNTAPFAPLQSKMVLIDGLNIVPQSLMPDASGNYTDQGGMVGIMTGQPALGRIVIQDFAAGGPSIDQIFLDRSPLLGGRASPSPVKTPFQSLQLAADIRSDRNEVAARVMSYRAPLPNQPDIGVARQPLFPVTQPLDVYNRLFGGPRPLGALLARKQIVLDFARRDLARMRGLVPASEVPKLDMYEGALETLETSLRSLLAGCASPPAPEVFAFTSPGDLNHPSPPLDGGILLTGADYYDPADPSNHPFQRLGLAHLALIRAAFQCDLARVATFLWTSASPWVQFPNPFQGAYTYQPSFYPSLPIAPPSRTTMSMPWLAQIDLWFSQQTAAYLQMLDATPDFDGNTLLDNTVVVYLSSCARAYDRSLMNVPFLVFGGKNTRIKGGQFIKIKDGPLPTTIGLPEAPAPVGNRPTNDVWLALAPIFGVDLPSLGAPTQYTGPLPGLVG